MHKIFAKPLFLGKKVVFLPQCHSTNDELLELVRKSNEPEGTVVFTDHQSKGKGQRGNAWVTESGKNILVSIVLRPKFLLLQDQHFLNLITGLAIMDLISSYSVNSNNLSLKWPNDVYLNDKKVAGILIENNLKGNTIESSVVGIGLNVNQRGFGISTATSLSLEFESSFDRDELLERLLCCLEKWYLMLKNGSKEQILNEYHKVLMWRGEQRIFKANSIEFQGEIIGIDRNGRLIINSSDMLKTFGIKEVEFIG